MYFLRCNILKYNEDLDKDNIMSISKLVRLALLFTTQIFLSVFVLHGQVETEPFWRINQSPGNMNVHVLAADSNNNIYACVWGDGIYRSTTKGLSWVKISTGLTNTCVNCLEIDRNGKMYAGTMGGGLFISTNNGSSWTEKNEGLTNLNVKAVGIGEGSIVYIGTYGHGVFKTNDGGETWKLASNGIYFRDINCFVVGADTSVIAGTNGGGIFKSTNGGASWYQVAAHMKSLTVTDMAMAESGAIYATTYGDGIYVSYLNGSFWVPFFHYDNYMPLYSKCIGYYDEENFFVGMYHDGLVRFDYLYAGIPDSSAWRLTSEWMMGINDIVITKDKQIFIAEPYNGIYLSTDKGKTFTEKRGFYTDFGPNGLYPLFAYENALLTSASNHKGIYHSSDKGVTWTCKGNESNSVYQYCSDDQGAIYAATGKGLYKSNDLGNSWDELTKNTANLVATYGTNIFTICMQTFIRRSTDLGLTWTTPNSDTPHCYTSPFLAIDNSGTIYTNCYSSLKRSTDNGVTFTELIPDSVDIANCYANYNSKIYIGTYHGIRVSDDKGDSWDLIRVCGRDSMEISNIVFNESGEMFVVSETQHYLLHSADLGKTWDTLRTGVIKSQVKTFTINKEGDLFLSSSMLYRAIHNRDLKVPVLSAPVDNASNLDVNPVLVWNEVENTDLYEVQLSLGNDFSEIIESAVTSSTEWKVQNTLGYGTRHFWRVRSKRNRSHSDWSEVRYFTTATAPPLLEFPPDSSYSIDTNVTFAWKKVESASSYQLQVATDEGFDNIVLDKNKLTAITQKASKLTLNTKYFWRVRALSSTSNSNWSGTWVFTTKLAAPIPQKPADKAITQSTDVTVKWDTVPGAKTYNIVLASDPDFKNILYDSLSTTDSTFVYGLYEVGKTYYWKVRALDLPNEGYWSESRRFTISQSQLTLIYPQNHSKNIPNDTPFEWNGPENAQSYHLQVSKDSIFQSIVFEETTLTATTKTVPGLDYGKHYWRVRYSLGGSYSEWTDTWQFSTDPGTAVLISPTDKSCNVVLQPELTWDAPKIAAAYILEVATDSGFTNIVYKKDKLTDKKITVPQLKNYTKYYWHVRFTVGADTSFWSETWTFGTCLAKTILVTPDDELKNCPPAMYFIWKSVTGATHYHLQFARDEAFADIYRDYDGIADTFMLVSDLDTNVTYYWRVNAHNNDGEGVWSVTWVFSVSGSRIDVEEDSPGKGLQIKARPNPFGEEATLEYTLEKDSYVEIYLIDLTGARVATLQEGAVLPPGRRLLNWDASHLAAGAYYYCIAINNKEHIYKILKID